MESKIVVNQETNSVLFDTNPDNIGTKLVAMVKGFEVLTPEHKTFLAENKERIQQVSQRTFMWRTNLEKQSIINDIQFPTLHAKFHQCILENSVFINETIRLAKDFETTKIDVEKLQLDIEELQYQNNQLDSENARDMFSIRRNNLEIQKKTLEIQEKTYNLQQMHTAMNYRMKENMDWKVLQDNLIEAMRERGYTDEQIWDKEYGQDESVFFLFLNKMMGIDQSTDGGEVENITSLAVFGTQTAIRAGKFDEYIKRCNGNQLKVLEKLGFIKMIQEQGSDKITLIKTFS